MPQNWGMEFGSNSPNFFWGEDAFDMLNLREGMVWTRQIWGLGVHIFVHPWHTPPPLPPPDVLTPSHILATEFT